MARGAIMSGAIMSGAILSGAIMTNIVWGLNILLNSLRLVDKTDIVTDDTLVLCNCKNFYSGFSAVETDVGIQSAIGFLKDKTNYNFIPGMAMKLLLLFMMLLVWQMDNADGLADPSKLQDILRKAMEDDTTIGNFNDEKFSYD